MTHRLLLFGSLSVAGCDMMSALDAPPTPEFLDTEATCAEGGMTFTALIRSELAVGNLVVERTDVDDADLDPVFPLVTTETFFGEVTEWTATLAHDCDTSIAVTWTATTVAETVAVAVAVAVAETAWPDVDLTAGPVQPPHGSTAGDSEVVIEGTDMDAVDRVWFDGALATIVEATPDAVTVRTPAHTEGTVDLRYAAGVTELDLPEAFTYWPDQSGVVVGIAHFVTQLYDASYFSIRSADVPEESFISSSFVQHEVLFHEALDPVDTFSENFYAPVGTCEAGELSWTRAYAGAYLALHEDSLGELPMIPDGSEPPPVLLRPAGDRLARLARRGLRPRDHRRDRHHAGHGARGRAPHHRAAHVAVLGPHRTQRLHGRRRPRAALDRRVHRQVQHRSVPRLPRLAGPPGLGLEHLLLRRHGRLGHHPLGGRDG